MSNKKLITMFMSSILLCCLAFLTACSSTVYSFPDTHYQKLADSFPMDKAIVINPDQYWKPGGWTGYTWREFDNNNIPTFFIGKKNIRQVWGYYNTRPINFGRYPFFVLEYRAKNIFTNVDGAVIWANFWLNSNTPMGAGVDMVLPNEIIPDGQLHVIRKDIRKIEPTGDITSFALSIVCNGKGPASFELVGLRFEATDDSAPIHEYKDAQTFNVKVVDRSGSPVSGASVIIDAEHPNFARHTKTDANGLASITAISNDWIMHMFRVTKPGMTTSQLFSTDKCKQAPIVFILDSLATYSGQVTDEQGKPIPYTVIELIPQGENYHPFKNNAPYTVPPYRFISDSQGKWQTQLGKNYSDVYIKMYNPDFTGKPAYVFEPVKPEDNPNASAQAMRDGTATSILKK